MKIITSIVLSLAVLIASPMTFGYVHVHPVARYIPHSHIVHRPIMHKPVVHKVHHHHTVVRTVPHRYHHPYRYDTFSYYVYPYLLGSMTTAAFLSRPTIVVEQPKVEQPVVVIQNSNTKQTVTTVIQR